MALVQQIVLIYDRVGSVGVIQDVSRIEHWIFMVSVVIVAEGEPVIVRERMVDPAEDFVVILAVGLRVGDSRLTGGIEAAGIADWNKLQQTSNRRVSSARPLCRG